MIFYMIGQKEKIFNCPGTSPDATLHMIIGMIGQKERIFNCPGIHAGVKRSATILGL
jgi:hypothetical protein